MGVIQPAGTSQNTPTAETALSRALSDELADKGFVVAQLDKLITWRAPARCGA